MKNGVLILAIVLALILPLAHAQQIWEFCHGDRSNDVLKVDDIVFSPNPPVSGGDFSVTVTGTMRSAVTKGSKVNVLVFFGDIPLFEGKLDLCDLGGPALGCPISPGPFKASIQERIPGIAPPGGPYNGNISISDQNNNPVTCINFRFNMDMRMAEPEVPALDNNIIDVINKDESAGWRAHRNPVFEGMTVADVQSKLGAQGVISVDSFRANLKNSMSPDFEDMRVMADSFDWRAVSPECVNAIRNQGKCGSCWAFGATSSLSDRFCIASKGKINEDLSPEFLVDCDKSNLGCNGGYLSNTWRFLSKVGVPTEKCYPYVAGDGKAGKCSKACADGSPMTLYKVKKISKPRSTKAIQKDIMKNGPVEAAFTVYQDFLNYKSGVYRHVSGNMLGGHAIKVLGWGVDQTNGQAYWICANSWGDSWGMNGYFWFRRGRNECGIEGNVIAGIPVL